MISNKEPWLTLPAAKDDLGPTVIKQTIAMNGPRDKNAERTMTGAYANAFSSVLALTDFDDPAAVQEVHDLLNLFCNKRFEKAYEQHYLRPPLPSERQFARSSLKKVLEAMPRNRVKRVFDIVAKTGHIERLGTMINNRESMLPSKTCAIFREWVLDHTNGMVKAMQNAQEDLTRAESIRVVEVENLLPHGESTIEAFSIPHGQSVSTDARDADIRTQPRLEWILESLNQDGIPPSAITLYKDKTIAGRTAENAYAVLDIDDGTRHFQFAVCDYVGHATYVIRKPIAFETGADVTIADLKKDRDVYQINLYTREQWIRNLKHYAYAAPEALTEQLKTRVYWADKKAAVEESFGGFYLETFQIPKSSDDSILAHGPLGGKTTLRRMYQALVRQAVDGLEKVRNFAQLKDHVFGPEAAPAPLLPAAEVMQARDIFNRAVLYMRDTGAVPEDADADHSLREFKVRGLDEFMPRPDQAKTVTSLKAFLVAAGLAEEKGDGIVPAAPILIRELARHIKPA